ncbi:MAG: ABC transporter permease subunit [Anaerolineaceae bacterium]|nr:ABC transporter permease subunit [Anaerolineaceae bacterium]
MKWKNVFAIARKDWIEVRQNKYAMVAMMVVPVIFVIVMPLVFTLLIPNFKVAPQNVLSSDADIQFFVEHMPESLTRYIDFAKPMESMIVILLGFMLAPMFLILPLMYATTIAAESFAGERERKTIESLLYTPASDADLLVGKVTAAAVPAILVTWIGFAVYTLILNLAPYRFFQRIWFPLPTWWPLIFWITPALVVMGIALTVIISARVQNFLGAYQTSASVVMLVLLLFAGQMSGVLYLSVGVEMILGVIFWLIALMLGYFAIKTFNRGALLTGKR